MSEQTLKTVRKIMGTVLAVLTLFCALSLMIACAQIYQSGNRPFTPENIATAWQGAAIFVWLFVACSIASGAFYLLFPAPQAKKKGVIFPELKLAKAEARLARKNYDEQLLAPLKRHHVYVRIMRISALVLCAISAVYPLIYLNNPNNFTSIDTLLNAQVIAAVIPSLCFAGAALLFCYAVRLLSDLSAERALVYAKAIMLLPAPRAEQKPVGKVSKALPAYTTIVLQVVLITVAVAMIVAGIFNGGMNDVLQKAIRICTECIGLG